MRLPENWALLFAVLCVTLAALMAGAPYFSNASQVPRGLPGPVVAVQLARTVQDIDMVLGDAPGPDREAARYKQYQDFAFIPCYVGLCGAILWSANRQIPGFKRTAMAGLLLALFAGVFDVIENLRILRLIKITLADTQLSFVQSIRFTAVSKFSAFALSALIIGAGFLKLRQRRRAYFAIGAGAAVGGLLLLAGMLIDPLVQYGMALTALALVTAAVTLKWNSLYSR